MTDVDRPTISVVIPTYNRSDLLLQALDSVLNQTYKPHEIIVVDDGSTDDTAARLGPYRSQIRYFRQDNRGASAAQNEGVKLATGKWVAILASDDKWLPPKLELQVKAVTSLGDSFGACFTDCSFKDGNTLIGSAFKDSSFAAGRDFGELENPLPLLLSYNALIYVQSLMFRRQIFENIGGFDTNLTVSEDVDLLFRMAFKTRFCFVNRPLVHIDRTPSRARLTDLFQEKDDRMFSSQEMCLKKWLSLPLDLDSDVSQKIKSLLAGSYSDWTVAKIYRFRLMQAWAIVRRQHGLGISYPHILRDLGARALRRVSSALGR